MNNAIEVGVNVFVFSFTKYLDVVVQVYPKLDLSLILVLGKRGEEEVVAEEEYAGVNEVVMAGDLKKFATILK